MQDHQSYLDCIVWPTALDVAQALFEVFSGYEITEKKEAAFDILITKCSGQSVP